MADLILVHREVDNEVVMINRDQIIYAEKYDSGSHIKFANGESLTIIEPLAALRNKSS